ncbi:hypothetical protein HED60_19540 [Planctomycetales bacterium ZRK34]|nr:hypothetical protein HED60_19540 [Planctomycetales bacterium ZRK34]
MFAEVGVYMNRADHKYFLQLHAPHPEHGHSVATDLFICVDEDHMRNQGINLVLDSLSERPELEGLIHWPFSEEVSRNPNAFHKQYAYVLVWSESSERLSLSPMGAAAGDPREIAIDLPCEPDKFFKLLYDSLVRDV